ncbi:hypothetical protein [Azospirillum sp.]|uniref:hypothetical protein n=1 Tax=Azospirillum sp. TaxID=34012 RepID=UPI002D2B89A1|nr:hypothetical protein [Azospirillum sp.]HYD69394.1 hypothetical protein [Azospirillum sp.]
MRRNNFALRLLPSLMNELRKAAAEEGVPINHYINIAVAEKLATRRTAAEFFAIRAQGGDPQDALDILRGLPPATGPEPEGSFEIIQPKKAG